MQCVDYTQIKCILKGLGCNMVRVFQTSGEKRAKKQKKILN